MKNPLNLIVCECRFQSLVHLKVNVIMKKVYTSLACPGHILDMQTQIFYRSFQSRLYTRYDPEREGAVGGTLRADGRLITMVLWARAGARKNCAGCRLVQCQIMWEQMGTIFREQTSTDRYCGLSHS